MAKITISVPDELKERMIKVAEADQRSLSAFIRLAIQEYLNKETSQK
jgi:predicted transcriptional regulator